MILSKGEIHHAISQTTYNDDETSDLSNNKKRNICELNLRQIRNKFETK